MRTGFGLIAIGIVVAGLAPGVGAAHAAPAPDASSEAPVPPRLDTAAKAKNEAAIRHRIAARHARLRAAHARRTGDASANSLSPLAYFFSGPAFWVYGISY